MAGKQLFAALPPLNLCPSPLLTSRWTGGPASLPPLLLTMYLRTFLAYSLGSSRSSALGTYTGNCRRTYTELLMAVKGKGDDACQSMQELCTQSYTGMPEI